MQARASSTFPLFRLVNNPSYGFLTLFSVLLALPFSKRKLVDPRVTSAPQRSASTEFPDVRVQSHCSGSQVSCISVWRQATALLSTYHPDPSTCYSAYRLGIRARICRTNERRPFGDVTGELIDHCWINKCMGVWCF